MTRMHLRNDGRYYVVNPALATEIGLNESIILTQLEFLISISNHTREGTQWTYQSLKDLQTMFPWMSQSTINRTLKTLENRELIQVRNYNQHGYDRTRWFALNETGLAKLSSIIMADEPIPSPQESHDEAICHFDHMASEAICHFDHMHLVKMNNAFSQNDTTIPKPTTVYNTENPESGTPGIEIDQSQLKEPPPVESPRSHTRTLHPAIETYQKIYPRHTLNEYQIARITARVGFSDDDLQCWKDVLEYWLGNNYRPSSIPKILDRFTEQRRNYGRSSPQETDIRRHEEEAALAYLDEHFPMSRYERSA